MTRTTRPSVLIVQRELPGYRLPFFAGLRADLARRGIGFRLLVGGSRVPIGRRELVWQPYQQEARKADLVVVEQASRLLLNYRLLLDQHLGRVRVGFWGHGANLASSDESALGEAVKRRVSRAPHWWFAYTEGSKRRVIALGYPDERITVVQNAVATEELLKLDAQLSDTEVAAFRDSLGLDGGPTALFLGALTPEKRIDLLLDATDRIRAAEPSFMLLIAGDGPGRSALSEAAARRPYIRLLGHVEGRQKVIALRSASALLLPAAVGLGILDGFALGLPLVTMADQGHGPEIEYLEPGANGLVLPGTSGSIEYAQTTLALLRDGNRLRRLGANAARTGRQITMSEMVQRFADGVEHALSAEPRR